MKTPNEIATKLVFDKFGFKHMKESAIIEHIAKAIAERDEQIKEACLQIAVTEAKSEAGWAKRYKGENDREASYLQAKGGQVAAGYIADGIKALDFGSTGNGSDK